MVLYIWLLAQHMIIYCAQGAGCMFTSMGHFDYLMGIGSLELVFELTGIIKIYFKKNDNGNKKGN